MIETWRTFVAFCPWLIVIGLWILWYSAHLRAKRAVDLFQAQRETLAAQSKQLRRYENCWIMVIDEMEVVYQGHLLSIQNECSFCETDTVQIIKENGNWKTHHPGGVNFANDRVGDGVLGLQS